jgi:hypothetical protein
MFSFKISPRDHLVTGDERNQLAKAWIALQKTPQHAPEYNSLFWSFEQTYDLVREDPVEAWKLILTIWSLDRSAPTRRNLSRGPIEELLCFHGESIIPHIEKQARADPSFATLLGGIGQNTMSDSIWHRLQEAWIALDGFPFLKTRRLQQQNQAQREKLPPLEVLQSALIEFAKLGALLLCMLSLYVVFRTLFLSIEDPHAILQPPQIFTNRMLDALLLIALSAAISLLGGIIFRESEPKPHPSLAATLPLQIFSWATSIMLTLFVLARFLETHYIFSPKVHW